MGTHWEPREMKKNPPHSPHPPQKKTLKGKKKQGTLSAWLGLPIGWMHEISLPKRVSSSQFLDSSLFFSFFLKIKSIHGLNKTRLFIFYSFFIKVINVWWIEQVSILENPKG
jgi:hypothetical protein